MEPRTLSYIAEACAGQVVQGDPARCVRRVWSDSRTAGEGDLFVAIPGERFDGHQFLGEVLQRGVAAVLVSRGRWDAAALPAGAHVIEVGEMRRALGGLAARYRLDFDIASVAVAGSNGKTTTKELIGSVLRQRMGTVWSEASFNNDIGVPFTLLRLECGHRAGVFELGTNHPGELAPLIDMVKPRIGVLTSIGREHLEFFGDMAGVAAEEGTLAEKLPRDGVLILNGDSEWTPVIERRAGCRVVRVGAGEASQWRAQGVEVSAGGTRFQVVAAPAGFEGEYRIGLLGRHQVGNALLAAAVGHELGLTPEEVRRGLAECRPAKSRLALSEIGGVLLLDDSYNANADSMIAALRTLRDLPCGAGGCRIAVLGDMAELGADTAAAHEEVGRVAGELGLGWLVAVGAQGPATLRAARAAGLAEGHACASSEEAVQLVRARVRPGDIVLVKASRAAGLNRVSDALKSLST